MSTHTTSISSLCQPIDIALRDAGAHLLTRPRIAPTPTMSAFRAAFDALETDVMAILRPALAALVPEATWIDELDAAALPRGRAWLVDSVDGAVQYMRGLPQWCLTATLLQDGEPVLAVLHNPVLGESYTAMRGEGAWRNGNPIVPSETGDIAVALVCTSQPPFAAQDPASVASAGSSLARVLGVAGAVRNLGPTSWQIADVAAGRLDGFWEYGDDRSNLLGSVLIAREAGAFVTDTAGEPWTPSSPSILVATPALGDTLLDALAR
ncbi:myo-inositol-1(or 4)-monophosphatase [Mycetocola sp. BIGb0189]|uniref:inositol monophosphatase family protein n=1 Tax=Mycetocola sp. BIGb0189 TaxID=2940604 RepID=UPI002167CCE6|nr:inositol monophosphatase family protein [Mycetocola sp. BIGb0189]MCS4275935.1 myo-inositol-1(or 4)-monophosphatase [Mycetocola sp. BIGb0189]